MADWVGHLAIAAGTGKVLRLKNLHVILLGALLPDIPGLVGVLSDRCWLAVDAYGLILALLPWTSLLAVVCLCLAMAAWLTHPWRAFGLLMIGAVSHILLDLLQSGHVQLLAYPFSFKVFNYPWYHYGGYGQWWINGILALGLLGLRWFPLTRDIRFSIKHAWMGGLPIVFFICLVIGNTPRLEASNILNLNFLKGNKSTDGEAVILLSALVVRDHPLVVKKGRREVEVEWKEPVKQGQVVSVWGRFHGDCVIADKVEHQCDYMKLLFSFIGIVLLALYWVDIPLMAIPDNYSGAL